MTTPVGSPAPQQKLVIDPFYENSWQYATEKYVMQFSAVSYYFGLDVNRQLDVPIGLILVALGGTSIQCWVPEEVVKNHDDYDQMIAYFKRELTWAENNAKSSKVVETYKMRNPSYLYNGMVHPLTKFPIKGMIWYQAERNQNDPTMYRTLFPDAITGWRKVWGQGDFPFFFVQLPGYLGKTKWAQDRSKTWPYVP